MTDKPNYPILPEIVKNPDTGHLEFRKPTTDELLQKLPIDSVLVKTEEGYIAYIIHESYRTFGETPQEALTNLLEAVKK